MSDTSQRSAASLPSNSMHNDDLFGFVNSSKPKFGVNLKTARNALEIGKAAEHLVCTDLILSGHKAFLSDQGMSYDVVLDHGGRLIRIQVKSTLNAKIHPSIKTPFYMFHVRRAGKGGKRVLSNNEFDLLALVALDIRTVAYIPINDRVLQCINLREPGGIPQKLKRLARRNIDQYPVDSALEEILRKKVGS